MNKKTKITCPHCKKYSGYHQEDFMFMVIYADIKCKQCNQVCISKPQIVW